VMRRGPSASLVGGNGGGQRRAEPVSVRWTWGEQAAGALAEQALRLSATMSAARAAP
jgi:hypothetical protein